MSFNQTDEMGIIDTGTLNTFGKSVYSFVINHRAPNSASQSRQIPCMVHDELIKLYECLRSEEY